MATIVCSKCKTENPPDSLYCQSCGSSLAGEEKTVMTSRKAAAIPPPPPPAAKPAAATLPPAIKAGTPPPPPPPSTPPTPVKPYYGTPVGKLGVRMDSWSEVIEGEAEAAEKISQAFVEEIQNMKADGVRIASSDLTSGMGGTRKFQVVDNGKGAVVAVRFSPMGKDLYFNWDLYARRSINWLPIALIGGIAFLLALIPAISASGFFYGVYIFIRDFLNLLLVPGLALLLLGKLLKDNIWSLYLNELDDFAMDDANALGILVDNAATRAIEKGIAEPERKSKK